MLLQEETARQPAKRRLALDVPLVGANHVAFHAPAADEAVESLSAGSGCGVVRSSAMTVLLCWSVDRGRREAMPVVIVAAEEIVGIGDVPARDIATCNKAMPF